MIGGIDRIELLRGANSLPWGSQAIGGVVSVTTTRPPADGSDRTTGRFGAEVGARDTVRLNGQLRTAAIGPAEFRSEEHTSELQSLMRISYAVFCLKKKKRPNSNITLHMINASTINNSQNEEIT